MEVFPYQNDLAGNKLNAESVAASGSVTRGYGTLVSRLADALASIAGQPLGSTPCSNRRPKHPEKVADYNEHESAARPAGR
ncbi:MAG: hypothetical protein ACREV1_05020, partial [Gammaproteobacteria bacterium]